ncbi:uncharacterized protein B0I36DRAFT_354078 [Microdochium trichocladiopsis]|uniref:ToxB-like N-terminal ascomycota domain-containing protein n=1 Tax=Microdochium trichocladiopsis TaxID=1682393 RepID=A0A9P9BIB7_9PEZI|nr:uncharacterized protein B0I36DRAFT_354078 [Microdochium trichocladiopsis]KAH7021415.1 hypothetical protein B0I36DRAFT_354078 [Microdochium trichocladiopsis]
MMRLSVVASNVFAAVVLASDITFYLNDSACTGAALVVRNVNPGTCASVPVGAPSIRFSGSASEARDLQGFPSLAPSCGGVNLPRGVPFGTCVGGGQSGPFRSASVRRRVGATAATSVGTQAGGGGDSCWTTGCGEADFIVHEDGSVLDIAGLEAGELTEVVSKKAPQDMGRYKFKDDCALTLAGHSYLELVTAGATVEEIMDGRNITLIAE